MQIHEKLRVMRVCKGWSQDEMAEKLGYSVNGYAKVERGEAKIKMDKLEKAAEVMGIDMQDLIGLNEKNIFNWADNSENSGVNCHYNLPQGTIILSETQCAHELDKARLLLQERDKEISNLKEIISLLKQQA